MEISQFGLSSYPSEVKELLRPPHTYLDTHRMVEHEALVPHIFKGNRADYFTDGMWGSVKADVQAFSGLPFKPQQLRTNFAQMCKDEGATIERVSRALRHRTTKTTEIYCARIRPEDVFRELESLFSDSDEPRW